MSGVRRGGKEGVFAVVGPRRKRGAEDGTASPGTT